MSLWGWFGLSGGLSDTLPSDELEILHQLGWTDNAIDQMGEALAESIIADYRQGILRKPGQTVDTQTGETMSGAVLPTSAPEVIEEAGGIGGGTFYQLQEPEAAAIDTFLTGVQSDLEAAAIQTAETVRGAGKAIAELPRNLVLIVGVALVALVLLRR